MNLKVICIDEGHTVSGSDYGAQGNELYESVETRELGSLIKKYIQHIGVQVDKCTIDYANSVSDSINKRLALANSKIYDLVLIIHFNSFSDSSANGCEAFILPNTNRYYSSTTSYNTNLAYAREILDVVCTTGGFYKRGGDVKFRDDLGMLLHTNSYAVYLEVCFLTNKRDADNYKANKDKIARALAEVITGKKINNTVEIKEKKKVKGIVIYSNDIDRRAAEYLADYLGLPTISSSTNFDYSTVNQDGIYAVGGAKGTYTSYLLDKNFISAKDRYETVKEVLKRIGKL